MADPTSSTQTTLGRSGTQQTSGPASHLRQEYDSWQTRFNTQPNVIQRFLEAQAAQLGGALTQKAAQVRFSLPDRIIISEGQPVPVPPEFREQMAGGLMDRLTRSDTVTTLRQRLAELEQSPNRALAVSAGLMRHSTAWHLVHQVLPSGRSVTYQSIEGEEIPTLPTGSVMQAASAITTSSDAIAEEGVQEAGRGRLASALRPGRPSVLHAPVGGLRRGQCPAG